MAVGSRGATRAVSCGVTLGTTAVAHGARLDGRAERGLRIAAQTVY